jgi:hypothetical protein
MPLRRFYGGPQINQARALTGRLDPLVDLPQPTLHIGEVVGIGEVISMPVTSTNDVWCQGL